MTKMDERKKQILCAAVQEYILTAEPVGSVKLVAKYRLPVSAATVRNELAALEDLGYLHQPHVSAGRLPTDMGYRFYVDNLVCGSSLGIEETKTIDLLFSALSREVEGLMRETSLMLSRITRYVAVVLAPAVKRSALKHLDLVWLSSRTVLLVTITETGLVAKKTLILDEAITELRLREIESILDPWIKGLTVKMIGERRKALVGIFQDSSRLIDLILDEVVACLDKDQEDQVFLEGTSNILTMPEFENYNKVQTLFQALEEGYALLGWLQSSLANKGVVVRIGSENEVPLAKEYSLVASGYGVGDNYQGTVGIIGPTRMDYGRAIAAVDYIAGNLSKVLGAMQTQ